MRPNLAAWTINVGMLAILAVPTSFAGDLSCTIADPTGDPNLSPGQGFDGVPYQDIVRTGIERTGGAMIFSMEVASAIPAAPTMKTPNGQVLWMWGMSTGPGAPQGFPLSPGVAGALEFWIHVAWDGESFKGEVIDRRQGLTGGAPIVTSVPFTVSGTRVTLTADSGLFGNPETFFWGSSTWFWPGHLGTTSPHVVDRAPDTVVVPACPTP